MRSNPIDRLRCFRRTQREYFEDEEEKRRSASHPRRQKERKRLSNEDAETFLSTSSSKRAGRGKNSIPQTSENWKTKRKRKKLLSFSMQSSTRKSRRLQSEKREREKRRRASSSSAYLQKKTPTPSSSREDAWEKHVCLSVCSLSIVCRRQKSVAKFDDVFSSLCAKRRSKSTPLNPTPLMFRVLVVQKKVL